MRSLLWLGAFALVAGCFDESDPRDTCATWGSQTAQRCAGAECSPDVEGLWFRGAPMDGSSSGGCDDYKVNPIAVGGTETIQVFTDPWMKDALADFDASVATPWAITATASGRCTVRAGDASRTALAIHGGGVHDDVVSIPSEPIDHVALAAAYDPASPYRFRQWNQVAIHVGTPVLLAVVLRSASQTALVDESMTISGAGATRTSWDTIAIPAIAQPGTVELAVAAGGGSRGTLSIPVVAGADRIVSQDEDLEDGHGSVYASSDKTFCFEGIRQDHTLVLGGTFGFAAAGAIELEPRVAPTPPATGLADNCVDVQPRQKGTAGPGTLTVTVDGVSRDFAITVD